MGTKNRLDGVAFPAAQQLQLFNSGDRSRVEHIFPCARIGPDQEPSQLPDLAAGSYQGSNGHIKGHSYRNSVLHALLNTPIFANFLRAHRGERSRRPCPIKNCLACAMEELRMYYWMPHPKDETGIKHALGRLWDTSRATFWGLISDRRIGPADEKDEFCADTFLIHFLTEMQRQLKAIPGEYQTFLRMFTVHTVQRWQCSLGCKVITGPQRWKQTLFLPVDVQKPIGRKPSQTNIINGIKLALERQAKLAPQRTAAQPECGHCSSVMVPGTKIVNYPEVLILIRNLDELDKDQQPDIPYLEKLKLEEFSLNPNEAKHYVLVAGVAEMQLTRTRTQNMAFARGGHVSNNDKWWAFTGRTDQADNIALLDRLQRPWDGTGPSIDHYVYPEILVYARKDNTGKKHAYSSNKAAEIQSWYINSPPATDVNQQTRDLIGREVIDIFTQSIGSGLLKCKIKLAPADPGPQESIPFMLDLGYELNGNHWKINTKLTGWMMPLDSHPSNAPQPTPEALEPARRYHRSMGRNNLLRTPTVADPPPRPFPPDTHNPPNNDPNDPHVKFAITGRPALDNAFQNLNPSAAEAEAQNQDAMDYDQQPPTSFAAHPHLQQHKTDKLQSFIDQHGDVIREHHNQGNRDGQRNKKSHKNNRGGGGDGGGGGNRGNFSNKNEFQNAQGGGGGNQQNKNNNNNNNHNHNNNQGGNGIRKGPWPKKGILLKGRGGRQ